MVVRAEGVREWGGSLLKGKEFLIGGDTNVLKLVVLIGPPGYVLNLTILATSKERILKVHELYLNKADTNKKERKKEGRKEKRDGNDKAG